MIYIFANNEHTHMRDVGGKAGYRLLFHPSQFDVIQRLDDARPREIISAQLVGTSGSTLTSESVLDNMQAADASPDIGGWRLLTNSEFFALFLATLDLNKWSKGMPMTVFANLHEHPLIRAGVVFAYPDMVTLPLLHLMSDVYDICRFIDPQHPQRSSRLKSYFKLVNPETTVKIFKKAPLSESTQRTSTALSAWWLQPHRAMSRGETEEHPRAFLFRHYFRSYDQFKQHNDDATAQSMAAWKTTQKFVSFVRRLWLSGIGQAAFEPDRFFTRQDEVEGFKKYIDGLDFQVDNPGATV